jgi:hypothetical protein
MWRRLGASGGMMVAMVTDAGSDEINVPGQSGLVRSTK